MKRCKLCVRKPILNRFKNKEIERMNKVLTQSYLFLETTEEIITGEDRHRPIVENRHLIMSCLLLRGFPSVLIGKRLNKNHASVLHAKNSIDNMTFTDPRYKNKFNALREYLSTNNYSFQ